MTAKELVPANAQVKCIVSSRSQTLPDCCLIHLSFGAMNREIATYPDV
jgi:hypothetical protein